LNNPEIIGLPPPVVALLIAFELSQTNIAGVQELSDLVGVAVVIFKRVQGERQHLVSYASASSGAQPANQFSENTPLQLACLILDEVIPCAHLKAFQMVCQRFYYPSSGDAGGRSP
jgi:hypothetical protein